MKYIKIHHEKCAEVFYTLYKRQVCVKYIQVFEKYLRIKRYEHTI